ncbi:MAG: choice-of-anchor L domain-containing protein, partial [Bacteroidia bacterium]
MALLFFSPGFIFSQLHVTNNNSATQLAQVILGNGVTISNATLNCGVNGAGTFSHTGMNLGITTGIILTTGYAAGAANPGSFFCNVTNGNNFSDPDLTLINTRANYDVCILNFDFVPLCDTVRINYIFGSEEYPQYLHQLYNDLFGIFLTGPNPNGGNYNAKNIATLPNGLTPVSIDSINEGWPTTSNGTHSEYYHDNFNHPNNDIAYNGYTIPITSKAALIACSQYHMKIAIADGGNGHNDSGVFIKGNSLGCMNAPSVASTTVFSCADKGKIKVNISNYSGTPSFTWMPGGQSADSISNVVAGTYTCYVNLPGVCNNFTTVATMPDFSSLALPSKTFSICKGQSVQLNATGAVTYTWLPATGLNNQYIYNPS